MKTFNEGSNPWAKIRNFHTNYSEFYYSTTFWQREAVCLHLNSNQNCIFVHYGEELF